MGNLLLVGVILLLVFILLLVLLNFIQAFNNRLIIKRLDVQSKRIDVTGQRIDLITGRNQIQPIKINLN